MLSLNPLTRKLWVFKKASQGENGFRAYNFRMSLGNALVTLLLKTRFILNNANHSNDIVAYPGKKDPRKEQ